MVWICWIIVNAKEISRTTPIYAKNIWWAVGLYHLISLYKSSQRLDYWITIPFQMPDKSSSEWHPHLGQIIFNPTLPSYDVPMVDVDVPSRSGRAWPYPLHSHKPCDPRCLSRWDLHRRGEASMSCKHYSASRLHAVGRSRRSRLSSRWYHLRKTTAGKAQSFSKAGPIRFFC